LLAEEYTFVAFSHFWFVFIDPFSSSPRHPTSTFMISPHLNDFPCFPPSFRSLDDYT